MKTRLTILFMALASLFAAPRAEAQYYQIANQIPQLIRPALSGGLNYKGFVEAGYIGGIGDKRADFLDISTVQGFRYADWFFMGVGAGVDVLFAHQNEDWGNGWGGNPSYNDYWNHSNTETAVMIPLFTDFRFNIGNTNTSAASFFIDLRLGASFLIGDDYVRIGDGYLTSTECFYLRPSLGVRIPVGGSNVKQAISIGVNYQLLTQNYWYYRGGSDATLSGFGATISYEW